MKIKTILWQRKTNFRAIYVCENCGTEKESFGYDDEHFIKNVIPAMRCDNCDAKENQNDS